MPERGPLEFDPRQHDQDEEGEHEPSECELCFERNHATAGDCRCGNCCRQMIIETSLRDAAREPQIAQLGLPIYDDLFGPRELVGYLLNSGPNHACVFLNQETNLCTIYPTRPLCCRVFDCRERQSETPGSSNGVT